MNTANEELTVAAPVVAFNKVTVCTLAYDAGWWIFAAPGEGSRRVIDSRQARALAGMLMNPWGQVDPEDVDDWSERGPCRVRHVAIPEQPQVKFEEVDKTADTSGDRELIGTTETHGPDDDVKTGLTRGDDWKLLLACDFHDHVQGIQCRATGDLGDERTVREIDRAKAAVNAAIKVLSNRQPVPTKKLAEMEALLKALKDYRFQYVLPMTGKGSPPRYRLFYPKATENLDKRVRTMLLRAIRSLSQGMPKASVSLLRTVHRGARLRYEPAPRWRWEVLPFDRKSLPRLGQQADKKSAA